MAKINISYDCSDLINELKMDLEEFGADFRINVWCIDKDGGIIYTNYDFIDKKDPIKSSELKSVEYIRQMTIRELLDRLEKQNSLI